MLRITYFGKTKLYSLKLQVHTLLWLVFSCYAKRIVTRCY